MMKRKQAKKIANYFEKLINKIVEAPKKEAVIMNIRGAEMFIKALELADVIDRYTSDEMSEAIWNAEQEAHKKIAVRGINPNG